ncbi:hypothetical protein [Neobacillus sp.]|uniref:hypothetical protein n=1 Tax=Neobacillus sp. TaxID=2675273 RepID=UPI00289A36D1|nr:hypothetical protein [Neobacillus sp.]
MNKRVVPPSFAAGKITAASNNVTVLTGLTYLKLSAASSEGLGTILIRIFLVKF